MFSIIETLICSFIFEDTVLRLLGLFGCTVKEISERSCLEEDFVNSICLALRQRGFVDDNNITTDVGKDYLKQTVLAESVEEKVVRVLFLPDIGVLLDPILHDFYSDADYDGYIDGGMVKMLIDAQDAGKSETRSGFFKNITKETTNMPYKIYSHDVKKIINKNNGTSDKKISLADGYAINISKQGSKVFLHVKCALQVGSVDQLIVSDGTKMISGALVQYLIENHGDYVNDLFNRATTIQSKNSSDNKKFVHERYYHVKHNLEELEDFVAGNNPDAAQINYERKRINLVRLNAAVEHALNYNLTQYPVSEERKKILYSQTPAENYRTLIAYARQINFPVEEDDALLYSLSKSAFKLYNVSGNSVPNLKFVLPLSIVSAVENNLSPFAVAAREMPKLFELFKILDSSKKFRHGAEDKKYLQIDYDAILAATKQLIHILLPEFQESAPDDHKKFSSEKNISQERLNAIVALKKVLGDKIYYEAGDNLRNTLIRLSPYYKGDAMLSPMDFVNYLYVCLENYIRHKTENYSHTVKTVSEIVADIENFIETSLPLSLRTVSEKMVIASNAGRNASLGAYILTMFGSLPKGLLEGKIKDNAELKKFFDDVGEIVSLRQHANNAELNLTLNESSLCRLRENTFDALKFMEGF